MVSQPLAARPSFPLDLPLNLAYNKTPKSWKSHGDGFLSRQGQPVDKKHVPLQRGVAHR